MQAPFSPRILSRLVVLLSLYHSACASPDATAVQWPSGATENPIIFVRSVNWFLNQFDDHWIHLVLGSSSVQVEPMQQPVSISVGFNMFQVPSRHLQQNFAPRLMVLLLPHYEENEVIELEEFLDDFSQMMKDCTNRLELRAEALVEGQQCDLTPDKPWLYAIWTSTAKRPKAMFGHKILVSEGLRLSCLLFQTQLMDESSNSSTAYYNVKRVYAANPILILQLHSCNGEGSNRMECRKEVDAINLELEEINPGENVQRRMNIFNPTSKGCNGYREHDSVEGILHSIANSSRVPVRLPNISLNPFKPDPLSLELMIKYLTVEEMEYEILDSRCYNLNLVDSEGHVISLELWLHHQLPFLLPSRSNWYVSASTPDALILVKSSDWYVATCDGTYQRLSYQFFLDPYDSATWSLILVSVILITGFLLAAAVVVVNLERERSEMHSFWNILYNLLTFGLGVLLGLAPDVRREIHSLRPLMTCFMVTFGIWGLLSVILSGAYTGIFISDLMKGVPMKSGWNSIRDLEGFAFYSRRYSNIPSEMGDLSYDTWVLPADFYERSEKPNACASQSENDSLVAESCPLILRLLEFGVQGDEIPNWTLWYLPKKQPNPGNWSQSQPPQIPNSAVYASMSPFDPVDSNLLPNEVEAFARALSTCHKSAIIETGEQMPHFTQYLKLRTKTSVALRVGDSVGKEFFTYDFYHHQSGRISEHAYRRLQSFLSSGVYHLWEKWHAIKYPDSWELGIQELKRNGRAHIIEGPQPLSMDSNLQTAFYILVYGCMSALASFVVEVVIQKVKRVLNA